MEPIESCVAENGMLKWADAEVAPSANGRQLQIVLASGEIIIASRDDSKTADLWDALRGGSTNFGIVTAVEMSCFPHPALFRGGLLSTYL